MDLKKLYNISSKGTITSGRIYWLPVNYALDFPPNLIFYDSTSKEYYPEENNYWCTNGKYKTDRGETQIIVSAKVRPFLVIQKPDTLSNLEKLSVPSWQQNTISGFPVTSYSNLTKTNRLVEDHSSNELTRIDPIRLKNNNDYVFHHYLPADSTTLLEKDSYIAITTLTRLHVKYFTHPGGAIAGNDYQKIIEKFKNIY